MESIKMFMKYAVILSVIGLLNMLPIANFVLAKTTAQNTANQLCPTPDTPGCSVRSVDDVYRILGNIVGYVYRIFFIVAVAMILFAAFTYLTSGGDPNKVTSARNQLLWATVAVIIALFSYAASSIIKSILDANSTIRV